MRNSSSTNKTKRVVVVVDDDDDKVAPELPAFLKTVSAACPPSDEAAPAILRLRQSGSASASANANATDDDVVAAKIVGASLLCFVVDPVWSRVYFLLGKERKMHNWRQGSEKWSDFGGKTSASAPSAEETAAKEFWEESLAVVKYFAHDELPRTEYSDIVRSLMQGEYLFQIRIMFGVASDPRHHVTFVKQIPWDPHVVLRFNKCRRLVLRRHGSSASNSNSNSNNDDDDDAARSQDWDALLRRHPCWCPPSALAASPSSRSSSLSSSSSYPAANARRRRRVRADNDGGERRQSWHALPRAPNAPASSSSSSSDDSAAADAWLMPRRPRRWRRRTVAPALARAPSARDDFLEKQALGFWSIPQLQKAVELKGILLKRDGKTEKCRASFTTLVELVLSELAFLRPDVF